MINNLSELAKHDDISLVCVSDVMAEQGWSRGHLLDLIFKNAMDVYWTVPEYLHADIVPWCLVEDFYSEQLLRKMHLGMKNISLKSYQDADYPWLFSDAQRIQLNDLQANSLKLGKTIVKLHCSEMVIWKKYFEYIHHSDNKYASQNAFDLFYWRSEHQHPIFDLSNFPNLPEEKTHELELDMRFNHIFDLKEHHIKWQFPFFKKVFLQDKNQWLSLENESVVLVRKPELASKLHVSGEFESLFVQWSDLHLNQSQILEYFQNSSMIEKSKSESLTVLDTPQVKIELTLESLENYLAGPELTGEEDYLSPALKKIVKFVLSEHQDLFDHAITRVSVTEVQNQLKKSLTPYNGEPSWGKEILKYISSDLLRKSGKKQIERKNSKEDWVGMNENLKAACWVAGIFWNKVVQEKSVITKINTHDDLRNVFMSWEKAESYQKDIKKYEYVVRKSYEEWIKNSNQDDRNTILPIGKKLEYLISISRVLPAMNKVEKTKNCLNKFFK